MDLVNIIIVILTALLVIAGVVTIVLAVTFIRITKQIKHLNGSTRSMIQVVGDTVRRADVGAKAAMFSALVAKKMKDRKKGKSEDEMA